MHTRNILFLTLDWSPKTSSLLFRGWNLIFGSFEGKLEKFHIEKDTKILLWNIIKCSFSYRFLNIRINCWNFLFFWKSSLNQFYPLIIFQQDVLCALIKFKLFFHNDALSHWISEKTVLRVYPTCERV
jgi:hypothetical protein